MSNINNTIDGLELARFEPGYVYDMSSSLGSLFICEGWAEPVASEEPALLVPLDKSTNESGNGPRNLTREPTTYRGSATGRPERPASPTASSRSAANRRK